MSQQAGSGERLAFGDPQARWVLLATVLGSGLAFVDGTVVNVALPRIGADLDAGMAGLQWTINAYTLTLAALILLGGSLGRPVRTATALRRRRRLVRGGLAGMRARAEHRRSSWPGRCKGWGARC